MFVSKGSKEKKRKDRKHDDKGRTSLPPIDERGREYPTLGTSVLSTLGLPTLRLSTSRVSVDGDDHALPLLRTRRGVKRRRETLQRVQLPAIELQRNQHWSASHSSNVNSDEREEARHLAQQGVISLNRGTFRYPSLSLNRASLRYPTSYTSNPRPQPQMTSSTWSEPPQAASYPEMTMSDVDQVLELQARSMRPGIGAKAKLDDDVTNKGRSPDPAAIPRPSISKDLGVDDALRDTDKFPTAKHDARDGFRKRVVGASTSLALDAILPSAHAETVGDTCNEMQNVYRPDPRRVSTTYKSLQQANTTGGVIDTIFKEYDKDNSGCLSSSELQPFLHAVSKDLYGNGVAVSQDDVNFVLAVCKNKKAMLQSGVTIKKDELFGALSVWDCYMQQAKDIDYLFNRYDTDQSGQLDKEELRSLLGDLGKKHGFDPPTEVELEYIFHEADTWRDGCIERLELAKAVAAYLVAKRWSAIGNQWDALTFTQFKQGVARHVEKHRDMGTSKLM